MGKVGSSSVYHSLQERFNNNPIYHIHLLSENMINKGELFKKSILKGNKSYLYNHEFRKKFMSSMENGEKWKIITLVREPIGRNLSAYFQNIDLYFPKFYEKSKNQLTDKMIIESFFKKFDHQRPQEWFDQEIKGLLGIDVFEEEFSISKGYKIYNREYFDLLIIRLEDLDKVADQAFSFFFDIPQFKLINKNIANDKQYSNIYRKIKKKMEFHKDYLDNSYQSKYAQHFYSKKELISYRKKWE